MAQMTKSQLQTLKTAINTSVDPALVTLRTAGNTGGIADYYALPTTSNAWNWAATAGTLDEAANYAHFTQANQTQQGTWAIFLQYAPRDMGKAHNRNTVTGVWGTATAGSDAEVILLACQVKANAGQMLYSSTTVSEGTVSGLKLTFTQTIDNQNVIDALALP